MTLETFGARLLLRRLVPADARMLAAYRSDPAVARFQSFDAPFPIDEARSLIDGSAAQDVGEPGWCQWAVERVGAPGIVGDLGIELLEDRRQAMIGYTIAPAFQGRGYATEALGLALDMLLVQRGLHRVSAECDARNAASVRLLERLGFRQEAHLRSATWHKGEWTDDYLYAMLADDWRELRGGLAAATTASPS